MQLHIDSDDSYLVAPKAELQDIFLSNKTSNPLLNTPIRIECALLEHVVSSVAEAETGFIFRNVKSAISIRKNVESFG